MMVTLAECQGRAWHLSAGCAGDRDERPRELQVFAQSVTTYKRKSQNLSWEV